MNIEKIQEHYDHAREKHPYFCDALVASQLPQSDIDHDEDVQIIVNMLHDMQRKNDNDILAGKVLCTNFLDEKKYEVLNAIVNGDTAAAVEECYDCIAVLLRMIDVLEGRQKLGKPEEGDIK